MSTTPVFLTLPKYVTITPSSALPKIRPAPSASPVSTSSGYASSTGNAMEEDCTPPKGKKRRLDHLTWEEKIQRKKLKNRVAAQTSRDRKKARMEDMEHEIETLTQKTEILQNKCESLQAINDSLLEKNQKLDLQLEMMRQQLEELQQPQETNKSSTLAAGTCAGSGINSNGLTVDTRTTAKVQLDGNAVEDCCALPALQDMLLLDEEFDANKLEELAESLLADISADMETGDRKSNKTVAETTSGTERLPRPVVGTTAECMESSQHSTTSYSLSIPKATQSQLQQQHNDATQNELQTQSDMKIDVTQVTTTTNPTNEAAQASSDKDSIVAKYPADTVFGTYDAKSNSITIVMDDDAVPVNEAVEEIYCDGVTSPNQADEIYMKYESYESPVVSPSQVYLNVHCPSDDEMDTEIVDVDDDLYFDPIAKFLRPKRPVISPLAKSPTPSLYSAISDHGYESIIGSPAMPTSNATAHIVSDVDDFTWNSSFNELFPTLI